MLGVGAVQWGVVRNMALEHRREVKAAGKSTVFEATGLDITSNKIKMSEHKVRLMSKGRFPEHMNFKYQFKGKFAKMM